MNRKLATASILGAVSILGLTGCGGPQLVFNGQELSDVEQSLEEIDTLWKQSLADGVKANVADDSRCYLQVSEDTVAETAVCGPVHYLGDEETTWDGAMLETVPADDADKYNLKQMPIGFMAGQQVQANTELYRPDGEELPAEVALEEPEAPVAESDTPFWLPVGQAPVQAESSSSKPGILKSPIGTVSVISTEISDRVGDASNRQQAPEGTQFLTINFSELKGFSPSSDKSALAVVAGDETYPIQTVEGMSVVLPVADAESAKLRLTHDGLDQDLSLSNLTRTDDAVAAGLYSDLAASPKDSDSRRGELKMNATEAENTFSGTLTYNVNADRLAYDLEKKWPEAGNAWLKVIFNTNTRGPEWKGEGYYRGVYDVNKTVEAPTLQVDGKTVVGEIGDQDQSLFGGGLEIWYQVPAASPQATFSADVKMTGTLKASSSSAKNAPGTAEHVYQVRDVNLEFAPQADQSGS